MSGERQQASSFLPETDSAEHVQKNSAKIVKKLTKIKMWLELMLDNDYLTIFPLYYKYKKLGIKNQVLGIIFLN